MGDYDPDRVRKMKRPHGLPFEHRQDRARRPQCAGCRAFGAVLHRGAGVPGLRRLSGGDGAGRHGVPALQPRPSRHRVGRLDEAPRRQMSSSITSPSRSRPSTRSCGRATICAGTGSRSISRAAAAPAASSRSNSATPTITGSRSTGASTRSAATAHVRPAPNGRVRAASRTRSPTRCAARTRPCTTRRCSRLSDRREAYPSGGRFLRSLAHSATSTAASSRAVAQRRGGGQNARQDQDRHDQRQRDENADRQRCAQHRDDQRKNDEQQAPTTTPIKNQTRPMAQRSQAICQHSRARGVRPLRQPARLGHGGG